VPAPGPDLASARPAESEVAIDPDSPEPPSIPVAAAPEEAPEPGASAAYVASVEGRVECSRAGGDRWFLAREGAPLQLGDRVRTRFSRARVEFESGSVLHVNRFTTLTLEKRAKPPGLSALGGEVYVESVPADKGFRVETPHGRATALGTGFGVEVERTGTTVLVVEGRVEVATDAGEVEIPAGREARLARRTSPPEGMREAKDVARRLGWTGEFGDGEPGRALAFDLRAGAAVGGDWETVSGSSAVQRSLARENAFFLFGERSWRDYRVSAKVVVEERGAGGYGVGLVGYWLDRGRNLRFRNVLSSWDLIAGYGQDTPALASAPGRLPVGAELRLLMELRSTPRGVLVRGKVWPAGSPEPARWTLEVLYEGGRHFSGRAGLWAYKCRASFSEVEVERLSATGTR
jgi:hypothetical protein